MPIEDFRNHCFIEANEIVRTVELVHQEADVRGTYRIQILKASEGTLRYFARYGVRKEPGGPWIPMEAPDVRRDNDADALDQAMASLNLAVAPPR